MHVHESSGLGIVGDHFVFSGERDHVSDLTAVLGGDERPSVLDDESFVTALDAIQGNPAFLSITFTGPLLEALGVLIQEGFEEFQEEDTPEGFERIIGLLAQASEQFGGTLTNAISYSDGICMIRFVGR